MYVASPAFATWTGAEGPEGGNHLRGLNYSRGGFDPIGPWYFFQPWWSPLEDGSLMFVNVC